jgi:hypothetical protein
MPRGTVHSPAKLSKYFFPAQGLALPPGAASSSPPPHPASGKVNERSAMVAKLLII